jgi:hypothetical protein
MNKLLNIQINNTVLILEKLIDPQLVKKLLECYKKLSSLSSSRHLTTSLCPAKLNHSKSPHSISLKPALILSSHLCPGPNSFRFPHEIPVCTSPYPYVPHSLSTLFFFI